MIIPVRCFTCGKVCDRPRGGKGARAPLPCFPSASAPAAAAFFLFLVHSHQKPFHPVPGHRQQVGHLPGAAAGGLLGDVSGGRERMQGVRERGGVWDGRGATARPTHRAARMHARLGGSARAPRATSAARQHVVVASHPQARGITGRRVPARTLPTLSPLSIISQPRPTPASPPSPQGRPRRARPHPVLLPPHAHDARRPDREAAQLQHAR